MVGKFCQNAHEIVSLFHNLFYKFENDLFRLLNVTKILLVDNYITHIEIV